MVAQDDNAAQNSYHLKRHSVTCSRDHGDAGVNKATVTAVTWKHSTYRLQARTARDT